VSPLHNIHSLFPRPGERLRAGKPARRVDPPLSGEAFSRDKNTAFKQRPAALARVETCGRPDLSEPFKPEKYNDTYRKELLDLIRARAESHPLPEPEKEQEREVADLMAAPGESVERTKKQREAPAKRKAS
jgi:hypothetical protein